MFTLVTNRSIWIAGIAIASMVLLGALILYTPPQALAGGPTPTPSPLTWTFDVSPASPVVGDDIKLTAYASGSGGLPQYTLILEDNPAIVALESPASVSTSMLGVPKSWDLGTLEEGDAHFHININYEHEVCLPTHCFFTFTFDASPQMSFDVGAGVAVGGIASLPPSQNVAQGGGSYAPVWIALISASMLFAIGTLAWYARRSVFR